ncbi:MAG: hypothetical protein AAGF11_45595, partial [Myxococcota bacterium]
QGGDARAAHEQYLKAHQVLRLAFPKGHPRTLKALVGLAQTEKELDPARAEQRFEDVLHLIRAQKEPDLRLMAASYNSLGDVQRTQAKQAAENGDATTAELKGNKASANLAAALETLERQSAEGLPNNSRPVHMNLCFLAEDREDWSAMLEHCRTAWTLRPESDADIGRHEVRNLLALAKAQQHSGKREDAIESLRAGLPLIAVEESIPVLLSLAELLWQTPALRDEAIDIVERGRRDLRSAANTEAIIEVDRWLGTHQPHE